MLARRCMPDSLFSLRVVPQSEDDAPGDNLISAFRLRRARSWCLSSSEDGSESSPVGPSGITLSCSPCFPDDCVRIDFIGIPPAPSVFEQSKRAETFGDGPKFPRGVYTLLDCPTAGNSIEGQLDSKSLPTTSITLTVGAEFPIDVWYARCGQTPPNFPYAPRPFHFPRSAQSRGHENQSVNTHVERIVPNIRQHAIAKPKRLQRSSRATGVFPYSLRNCRHATRSCAPPQCVGISPST